MDGDVFRLMSAGFEKEEIEILFLAWRTLKEVPEATEFTLVALGVSWAQQQRLFGGIEHLRKLMGIESRDRKPVLSPETLELDEQAMFDPITLPCWRSLTPKGFVLCKVNDMDAVGVFLHKQSGVHLAIYVE